MDLYTGPSVVHLLNARLAKKTTLSEHEVLKIFSSVVVAVGRLHHRTKPIIHRDLKVFRVNYKSPSVLQIPWPSLLLTILSYSSLQVSLGTPSLLQVP